MSAETQEHEWSLDEFCHHHRWHTWRIVRWFARYAYPLGLISDWGASYNSCAKCPVRYSLRWRGRRPYILGKRREFWHCLIRHRHIYTEHVDCGLCSKCVPCPECDSTDPRHMTRYDCTGSAS